MRGFLAGFTPSEVFKGHLTLKRTILSLLKETYPDNEKISDQFRIIVEDEINGHLETIIESYHQESTAVLQESEQKYKILTDSALTGIFIHQDDKYVFVDYEGSIDSTPEQTGKAHGVFGILYSRFQLPNKNSNFSIIFVCVFIVFSILLPFVSLL